jgi:hypothetical protein
MAPPVLGLGIWMAAAVQDPVITALSSVQHDRRGPHLALAQFDPRSGVAAFQDGDYSDSLAGSSKRICLDESSSAQFRKSDPETYRFDVDQHCGPDTFFLFGILLCYHDPIASGHFLSLPDHCVPPKWSLALGVLGIEWMRNHVSSTASHSKAYTWLRSSIFALMQHGTMGAWQPDISKAFLMHQFLSSLLMQVVGRLGVEECS